MKMIQNTTFLIGLLAAIMAATSCSDNTTKIDVPADYSFVRDGQSTVNFSGQTTRILMAEELAEAMANPQIELSTLQELYTNQGSSGEDVAPYTNDDLNNSTKSIASKVAASSDYFASNTVEAAKIRKDFMDWMELLTSATYPNANKLAAPGQAGQILDGTTTRYVSAHGLEYNQLVGKSLLGALMMDQMLNNYLSPTVLDEAENRAENDAKINAEGKGYTTMEHKWDEAYGYIYGTSIDPRDPMTTLGDDDNYLNEYVGKVAQDPDFASIGTDIYNAFLKGRAAIVAGEYEVRDEQADIIKVTLSKAVAIRAVYYLQQGKFAIANGDMGAAFHDLSEAYGFIYSLRFSRNPITDSSYFSREELDSMLDELVGDADGLWSVSAGTLDALSVTIATALDFDIMEAAE